MLERPFLMIRFDGKKIEKIVKENETLIRWGNNKVDKYGFITQKKLI